MKMKFLTASLCLYQRMAPNSTQIWLHILLKYGSPIYPNMAPHSTQIWLLILLKYSSPSPGYGSPSDYCAIRIHFWFSLL